MLRSFAYFVLLLLAACSSTPTLVPTRAPTALALPPTPTVSTPFAPATATAAPSNTPTPTETATPTAVPLDPLTIQYLREQSFPGSDIKIEQTLAQGVNYSRYIASYESDGLKIFALLTVPNGKRPATGWPVIVFNHGYIPPAQYRTTERYVAYVDAIARSGYIVFKSDYRGHGDSEGSAQGGYGSPAYTIDVLNAVASLKKYPDADPNRIGMWGHSMGGQVTLRAMVVSKEIKAGVIWGGVVGTYPDLLTNWHHGPGRTFAPRQSMSWRSRLIQEYGSPVTNPDFWASISPNTYVGDISGPVQLDHGGSDEEVPVAFSQELYDQLKAAGKTTEFYIYPGSDHNISQGFALAMQRSIAWFDKYVKPLNPG